MLTKTSGVKLVDSLDVMSWYTGKIEVVEYLENLNSKEKVRQISLHSLYGIHIDVPLDSRILPIPTRLIHGLSLPSTQNLQISHYHNCQF